MTITETLLRRDGSEFTGKVHHDSKGKPFYVVIDACQRCGGPGGYERWPGFTCFRCGGSGKEQPREVKLYTAEQIVKLDAAQAKRDAKRDAKLALAQAAENARKAEAAAAFEAGYVALLARADGFAGQDATLDDVIAKGRHWGSLSPAQVKLAEDLCARLEARQAVAATSNHVSEPGARIEVSVTVTGLASYQRAPFRSYRRDAVETVWIVTMTDAAGNQIVSKTPSFKAEVGEAFTLRATVKAHGDYRGVKQTVVSRPTIKEAK